MKNFDIINKDLIISKILFVLTKKYIIKYFKIIFVKIIEIYLLDLL